MIDAIELEADIDFVHVRPMQQDKKGEKKGEKKDTKEEKPSKEEVVKYSLLDAVCCHFMLT